MAAALRGGHSSLSQITPAKVAGLEVAWAQRKMILRAPPKVSSTDESITRKQRRSISAIRFAPAPVRLPHAGNSTTTSRTKWSWSSTSSSSHPLASASTTICLLGSALVAPQSGY